MKITKKFAALFLAIIMLCTTMSVCFSAVAAAVKVTSVSLNKTSATLYTNATLTLKATVKPTNATKKTVSWSSGNKSVATVSSTGVVSPKKAGTVTITATAKDGSGKKASCKVTVKKFVKITKVTLNKTSASVNNGKTVTLKETVSPSNASKKAVSWTSSNTAVAKVSASGVVTGVKPGTATITCKATDGSGKKTTCKVTVKKQLAQGITLKTTASVYEGKTVTLTPTVTPKNTYNKSVKWKSADTSVATVSSMGKVKGIKAGKVRITCAAEDGSGVSASCLVTVKKYATSITLDKTSAVIFSDQTVTLVATVNPSSATNKNVEWFSSDTTVATVNSNGVVTPVKGAEGKTATITCRTADGSKLTATCSVTIGTHISLVSLNTNHIYLNQGKSETLILTTTPASGITGAVVKWTSSDEKIATVDKNGKVTAVAASGSAVITCTVTDGSGLSKQRPCQVTIDTAASRVVLDKTTVEVYPGKTATITATVYPESVSNKKVTWASSNTSVAKVLSNGTVKGVAPGKATISCTVETTGGKVVSTCVAIVNTYVSAIKLDRTTASVYPGKTISINASVSPNDATNKTIKWTTSDKSIATVDEKGVVTGVKPGVVTVTCAAQDGSEITATCTVTVNTYVENITVTPSSVTLYPGKSANVSATVSPDSATNKDLDWKSSDKNIATIAGGVITAVKAGNVTITATSKDGSNVSATISVTVVPYVSDIVLTNPDDIYPGETTKINATVLPVNAPDKTVTWTSSNPQIATVDKNGVVTGVKSGTVTITCKANDGSNVSESVKVTVKAYATSIKITANKNAVYPGETVVLIANAEPSGASSAVEWKSSNDSVATVNSLGIVTAKSAGEAVITATAKDGSKVTATYKITVKQHVTGISISQTSLTLKEGETATLTVNLVPTNATDKSVKWVSDNTEVVTVSNGVVTAKGQGRANVSCIANDGSGASVSCVVTVVSSDS